MKELLFSFLISLSILFLPFVVFADVKINEIAWMGDSKSAYCEWIELYNDGDSEVDLKDSKIFEKGTNGQDVTVLFLTKKITAKGYYLVERTTNSCPDPVDGIGDDIGSFGGSGLSNSGEYLTLKSSSGTILDFLDASKGWPAGGDAKSDLTMQKDGSGVWITATATPGLKNYLITSSTNPIVENITSSSTATTTQSTANKDTVEESLASEMGNYSAHSGGESISKAPVKIKVTLSAGRDRFVLADTPVFFSAKLLDSASNKIDGDLYSWSFGDGSSYSGSQVFHNYDLPGIYIVILNSTFEGQSYVSRSNIKVIEPDFKIEKIQKNGEYFVKIANNLDLEVNLKDWKLRSGFRYFTFANDTIILPEKDIIFDSKITGIELNYSDFIELLSPSGKLIAIFKPDVYKVVDKTVDNLLIKSFGNDVSKKANGDKGVDKYVDKPVDSLVDKPVEVQLAILMDKLRVLQGLATTTATSTSSRVLKNTVKQNISVEVDSKPAMVGKINVGVPTTTNKVILTLEPKNKESGLWKFIKEIFNR
ncbi:MAG: lamin tail domain-containing protein [bacterium]